MDYSKEDLKEIIGTISEGVKIEDEENLSENQLLISIGKILDEKFKGRRIAPNCAEVEKFEVKSVHYEWVLQRYLIKGVSVKEEKEVEHIFKLDDIVNLCVDKITQTIKGIYMFCK